MIVSGYGRLREVTKGYRRLGKIVAIFSISAIFLIFFTIHPTFALDKSLSIEAESLYYDKDQGFLEATGEVRVNYHDIEIFAEHLVMDTRASRIAADRGFILNQDAYTLSGENLAYSLITRTGEASAVMVNLKGIIARGRRFYVSKDEIELEEANFTTCDLEPNHYRISAQNIYMYPESGWVIARLGFLWAGPVPILPVPAFIYVIESIAGRRYPYPLPLPMIGETANDGFHISEKISYVISPLSYGILGVEYFSKSGLGFSLEHTFVSGDQNEDNLRLGYIPKYGWSAGFTHDFYLGEEAKRSEKYAWRARLDIRSREQINYETVSFLPKLILTSPDYVLADRLGSKLLFSWGRVFEESSALLAEVSQMQARLDYTLDLGYGLALIPAVQLENSWYGGGPVWHKLQLASTLRKHWFGDKLTTEVGYTHYALQHGMTPFTYEKYRFFADDRVNGKIDLEILDATVGIEAVYNLGRQDFDELDYSSAYRFHCVDAKIEWRSQRREFSFGLSIPSL